MKNLIAIFSLYLILVSISLGQTEIIDVVNESTLNLNKSYKVDPRPFLDKSEKELYKIVENNPDYFNQLKLRKSASWGFSVGSTKTWKSIDIGKSTTSNVFHDVPATCRAVGEYCYIFVEDALWNNRVDQNAVEAIANAFDNETPADPNKGIYETVIENFGDIANIDNDPKVIILVLDILDGYTGSGGYVAGYFWSGNQYSQSDVPNSNEAEIYFLDADPVNLQTESGLYSALNTTSHEFQHMVHYNYNIKRFPVGQITFINEGCSLVSEVICGYPIYNQTLFNSEPNHTIFDWRDGDDVLKDYSRAARFTTYLYDQYGKEFIKNLVQTKYQEIPGLNSALNKTEAANGIKFYTSSSSGTGVLENWFLANVINSTESNPLYGYTTPGITRVNGDMHNNATVSKKSVTLQKGGAYYISYLSGEKLQIKFEGSKKSYIKIKSIKVNDNETIVEDITIGEDYNVLDFGTNYDKVHFVVMHTDIVEDNYTFSYSSTGDVSATQEIAYDYNEPTGVLLGSPNDTVCVYFDGTSGMQIDSIRVALRQAGTVMGRLYKFTGNKPQPTPIGKPLTEEFAITSTIAERPGVPYPIPWTNWVTVDLRDKNLSADESFVVGIIVDGEYQGDGSGANRVMVTSQANDGNIHSFSYLNNPGSGDPRWVYSTNDASQVYNYLIRAYVGLVTDVKEELVDLIANEYTLTQNYPNPFNPTTTIDYSIPENGFVTLKIYDSIGKEVATVVNSEKSAGKYQVQFNASDLSSGVYFYTIKADSFIQTKKMMLLK